MTATATGTGTAVATRAPTNLEKELAAHRPTFRAALPAHISEERFERVLITAINKTPDLWLKADRRTFYLAACQCAADGLVPDGREAALVIYNTKDRKTGGFTKAVQYLPMIAGTIKRMRNSGDVASVDAQVVYRNDQFSYQLGDEPKIVHIPTLGDPGPIVGAYAVIRLANGEILREVMSVAQIQEVRAVSRAANDGPWTKWFGEMARKTVLRRCSKRAPFSPDLERSLELDEEYGEPRAELPARPTRESVALEATMEAGGGGALIEHRPEPEVEPAPEPLEWEIVDPDGEVQCFTSPEGAAGFLIATLENPAVSWDQKRGLIDTNLEMISRLPPALDRRVMGTFALAQEQDKERARLNAAPPDSGERADRGEGGAAGSSGAKPASGPPPGGAIASETSTLFPADSPAAAPPSDLVILAQDILAGARDQKTAAQLDDYIHAQSADIARLSPGIRDKLRLDMEALRKTLNRVRTGQRPV